MRQQVPIWMFIEMERNMTTLRFMQHVLARVKMKSSSLISSKQ